MSVVWEKVCVRGQGEAGCGRLRHRLPSGLGISAGQGLQMALGARALCPGLGVAVRGLPSSPECCDPTVLHPQRGTSVFLEGCNCNHYVLQIPLGHKKQNICSKKCFEKFRVED